ncbi:MAG: AI-2E family transporter [Candidatus Wolfebacteria bacterium]|nr:AI-2E family transporter [Candidatus Wolfebacteria bacterium]
MDKNKTEIVISWATLWRIFAMIILVAALFLAKEVIVILFLAIIISASLDGPVSYLARKKIPRIVGTLALFLIVFSAFALILYTIIPLSISELKDFLENIGKVKLPIFGSINGTQWQQKLDQGLGAITDSLFSGDASFLSIIGTIFGNAILIITTIVLSFYLTVSRSGVEKFLRAVLPLTYEEYAIDVYFRVRKKLGLWLQGEVIIMATVGLFVFIGLSLLGVKYSLVLGILAGLLEIVPIAGPIFTGIIGFLVAFSQSWTLAVYSVILFTVIQQLENHFLVPVVMRKTVGISPVVVVVAILAGSAIAGVIGIILAVPVAVIFQELVDDLEKRKSWARKNKLDLA